MRISEIDAIELPEYIAILSAAIKHYGATMQEDVAIEEMSELTQAIMHFRRGRESNIPEEIADVEIMLEQLKIIYQCAPLTEHFKAVKIARLKERMDDNAADRAGTQSDCQWEHGEADERIADHLLANGIIVPPVNTGDTIYSISTGKLNELRVESISATMYHDRINIGVHATNYRGAFLLLEMCDFGKNVFLTREEAEQALKERCENNG